MKKLSPLQLQWLGIYFAICVSNSLRFINLSGYQAVIILITVHVIALSVTIPPNEK